MKNTRNNIITYNQMCQQENTSSMQRGMTFRHKGKYSILLMSLRKSALYQDAVINDGKTLIYEGHDVNKSATVDPKKIGQPEYTDKGSLTENGKFHAAAQNHVKGLAKPELVKVYEKLKSGIWSDNGFFHLVNSYQVLQEDRYVFKFRLETIDDEITNIENSIHCEELKRSRIIPTDVKVEVWKRDKGACIMCGAHDDLHFDHIIPFSKGGSSSKVDNVQILCARHNLSKNNKLI